MSDQVTDSGAATASAVSTELGANSGSVSQPEQENLSASPSGETNSNLADPLVAASPEAATTSDESAVSTAAVEGDEPKLDFDPESLDEKVRQAFIGYRTENKELKQFRQQAEPVSAWVQERGGLENVQRDLSLVEAALSDDPQARATFHATFYEESPQAYMRFVGDLIADEGVQRSALQQMGLNPELIDLYKQVTETGAVPQGAPAVQFDQEWLSAIKPEYRDLLKSLDPEYQADLALRDPKIANSDLEYRAKVNAIEQEQARATQARQEQTVEAQKRAIEQRTNAVYSGIRSSVQAEIAKAFPGDTDVQEMMTNAAEAALLSSPKGGALWKEIEDAVRAGEKRTWETKTPQIIAEALVQIKERVQKHASVYEKARKYDELMRQQSGGRDVAPGMGQTVTLGNGKIALPNPNARGQFDPANITKYWPGQ